MDECVGEWVEGTSYLCDGGQGAFEEVEVELLEFGAGDGEG